MKNASRNKIIIIGIGTALILSSVFFSRWNVLTFQKEMKEDVYRDLFFTAGIVNNLTAIAFGEAANIANTLEPNNQINLSITDLEKEMEFKVPKNLVDYMKRPSTACDTLVYYTNNGVSLHLFHTKSNQLGFSVDANHDTTEPKNINQITHKGNCISITHPIPNKDNQLLYVKLIYKTSSFYKAIHELIVEKNFEIHFTENSVDDIINSLQPLKTDESHSGVEAYGVGFSDFINSLDRREKRKHSYEHKDGHMHIVVRVPVDYGKFNGNIFVSTNYMVVSDAVFDYTTSVVLVLIGFVALMGFLIIVSWHFSVQNLKIRKETDYQRKISASENRYWSMFDASPIPMLIHNANGDIITTNHEMVHFVNVNGRKEIIGRTVFDFFEGEQHPYFRSKIKSLMSGKTQRERFILKIQPKGGTQRYTEVVGSVFVFDKKKNIQLVMIDLTEKRKAEKLSLRFNKILTDSYNEIYFFSADTYKFIQVTKGALQTLGYSSDEIIQMTPLDITNYKIEEFEELLAPLIRREKNQLVFETKHRRKDGSTYPIEVRLQLSHDETPAIFIAIIQNLSERKEASEKLEERDRLISALSDASFEAVFLSKNGLCIGQNLAAETMFGYSFEEAQGHEMSNWIAPDNRTELANFLKSGYKGYIRSNGLRHDGSIFPCEIKGRISVFDGEEITVTSITDISEQLAAEKELIAAKEKAEESDKLKSAFLANISHEIRTPMNGIIGFSQLLKSDDLTNEEMETYIDTIDNCSNYLLSTIDDIINISRIETGLIVLFEAETSINEILQSSLNQHQLQASNKKIAISCDEMLSEADEKVIADEKKIRQVLNNLIDNAVKFTEKGSVKLGCRVKGAFLEFYVSDSGIGISSSNQSVIFDRFRQAEIDVENLTGGTGLGLAISKAYIEKMGGHISIESEIDEGSTFYFTVPFKPLLGLDSVREKQAPKVDYSNKFILVAEDEEANYKYLKLLLSDTGASVLRAKNGQEAVRICQQDERIDLVLMDIKMPIMDGYEATKSIKSFAPQIPIIAQTAYALLHDSNLAMKAGCDDYISKPIDRGLLMEKVAKAFRG